MKKDRVLKGKLRLGSIRRATLHALELSADAELYGLSPEAYRDGSGSLVVVALLAMNESTKEFGVDGRYQRQLDLVGFGRASGVGPAIGLRQRNDELDNL